NRLVSGKTEGAKQHHHPSPRKSGCHGWPLRAGHALAFSPSSFQISHFKSPLPAPAPLHLLPSTPLRPPPPSQATTTFPNCPPGRVPRRPAPRRPRSRLLSLSLSDFALPTSPSCPRSPSPPHLHTPAPSPSLPRNHVLPKLPPRLEPRKRLRPLLRREHLVHH